MFKPLVAISYPMRCNREAIIISWKLNNRLTAKVLLALASTAIIGSESHRTHGHNYPLKALGAFQILSLLPLGAFKILSLLPLTERVLNFCWPSPAQLFLVPSPTGPTATIYPLTALRAFQTLSLLPLTERLLNFCWPSPAQLFLVPSARGPMAIIYPLTALRAFQTLSLLPLTKRLLNCGWPSPAQLFLVPSPTWLMTVLYSMTALGATWNSSKQHLEIQLYIGGNTLRLRYREQLVSAPLLREPYETHRHTGERMQSLVR
jgi:hypothetical protein